MENEFWQKILGKKGPCIIAEIGTNHNGDLDIAKKLVDAAAIAGADCVKFQIYESQEIVSRNVRAKDYGLHELYGDIAAEEMFDKFINRLHTEIDLHEINIIDEDHSDITASVREDILDQGEDTLTFLGNYIEQIDTDLDRQQLKDFINKLYKEALE